MTRALRAAVATAAVALTLPAGAHAASGTSVAKSVDRAGALTTKAVKLAKKGSDAKTAKAVKDARRTVTKASRDARKLATKARTTSKRLDAAGLLALVGARLADDVEAYASTVPAVDGGAQKSLANALPGTVAAHEAIISALQRLAAKLPTEHRAAVEQVIAALVAEWPVQIQALADAATAEDVPSAINGLIDSALGSATRILQEAIAALQSVVGTLPEPAQANIGQAISQVQPVLNNVLGIVADLSKTITTQVSSILDMVTGLVGDLVPSILGTFGFGDKQDAPADAPTSGLSKLFDRIPVVGGLLDGLLGGLPIIGNLFGGR